MRKNLIVCIVSLIITSGLAVQAQHCRIQYNMRNDNRYIWGAPLYAECPGDGIIFPHSAPFGNFAVSSNVGDLDDSNQWPGWNGPWNDPDRTYEWSACSSVYPPPDCEFYNANSCTDQVSTSGSQGDYGNYGGGWVYLSVSCPEDWNGDEIVDMGGCLDVDGMQFTVSGNFTSVYEYDPGGGHEFIRTLHYPTRSVTLDCPTDDYCNAVNSSYAYPQRWDDGVQSYYPNDPEDDRRLNAAIGIEVVNGYFVDPYGYCDGWQP